MMQAWAFISVWAFERVSEECWTFWGMPEITHAAPWT